MDHIREVSVDSADEVIVIVGHGPSDSAENQAELAILQRHVDAIRKSGGYSDVVAINLQDDAPDEIRAANVKRLREIVESVEAMGKQTIVVPFLMMTGRVRNKLNNDLAGLDFKFNSAGLSAHPKFAQWIAEAVQPGASSSD